MKSYDEMFNLIVKTAKEDERIRAMTMEGSNTSKNAVHDKYSDFDITFFVKDVRDFSNDRDYMDRFGDVLILQRPEDYYLKPYDYNGRNNYAFLTQYKDGNRIDLTIVDISRMEEQKNFNEPRMVIINKDNFALLKNIETNEMFNIQRPGEFEFFNTCNEFRWVSNYATKGLCRHEFFYAKRIMELYMMDMFMKMINWKIGIENDFAVSTGANSKYLKRYLSEEEMQRFTGIFAGGEYEDMWKNCLLCMIILMSLQNSWHNP